MKKTVCYFMLLFAATLLSCNEDEAVEASIGLESSYSMGKGDEIKITPIISGIVNPEYQWLISGEVISTEEALVYTQDKVGEYPVRLTVGSSKQQVHKDFVIKVMETDLLLTMEVEANKTILIEPELKVNGEMTYLWSVESAPSKLYSLAADGQNATFIASVAGEYKVNLTYTVNERSYLCVAVISVKESSSTLSAYITKVLDFMPAVGQFTNELPKYETGDTQAKMNERVLKIIGNNNKGMITLGGFGGYVVVGFDHTIMNVEGKRDFRVIANAFYSAANPDTNAPEGGSCEPGVIVVAYDANKNGVPDDNEWYEIAGSSHVDPTKELWYSKALAAGNDVKTYFNYEITYHRPAAEPTTAEDKLQYIRWEDNQGQSGYKVKNQFHNQPYFPQWATGNTITFKGTCLPQNAVDESGQGSYYVLYKYIYGYADNETNTKDEASIDIDWAINDKRQKVKLPGVDFVKIYTGVNQENGWLGECSTEITSVEDLHVLGVDINTRK